jgi:hypothetical protein
LGSLVEILGGSLTSRYIKDGGRSYHWPFSTNLSGLLLDTLTVSTTCYHPVQVFSITFFGNTSILVDKVAGWVIKTPLLLLCWVSPQIVLDCDRFVVKKGYKIGKFKKVCWMTARRLSARLFAVIAPTFTTPFRYTCRKERTVIHQLLKWRKPVQAKKR